METIKRVTELRARLAGIRRQGKTVGFVPTMGFWHEGHLSLLRQARAENEVVVASIFVNPLQFGPSEDYASYPRDLDRDGHLAEEIGVDVLFVPAVTEIYPRGCQELRTIVEVQELSGRLCGEFRPGHFAGVTTVVCKLFHIVEPDTAYFGQKDAQQVVIIRRMVEDLNMNIRIVAGPTVRENDGLAMSSRNVYLNPAEREAARVLNRSLQQAAEQLKTGERDAAKVSAAIRAMIEQEQLAKVDYVSLSDPAKLSAVSVIESPVLIALAVRIGKVRLIDNLLWAG